MKVVPFAGMPGEAAMLVDVPSRTRAFYTEKPNSSAQEQRKSAQFEGINQNRRYALTVELKKFDKGRLLKVHLTGKLVKKDYKTFTSITRKQLSRETGWLKSETIMICA